MIDKQEIIGLSKDELAAFLVEMGEKSFRLKQIWQWLYVQGVKSFDEMTNLSKELRLKLESRFVLSRPKIVTEQISSDKTHKWLLEFSDGQRIETVFIPEDDRGAVCVSTQVGCAVGCKFCHTGSQKITRNLTATEIVAQFMLVKDAYGEWPSSSNSSRLVSNIVVMGMGEPLVNYLNSVKAVQNLTNPDFLNIGARHISISTSGIADKLHKLAVDLPQVNLAVSLHNADNDERSKLMPVNRRYDLEELQKALDEYLALTGRQVFLEYAVIDGVNNRPEHIRKLGKWIKDSKFSYLLHVNLIACNLGRGAKTDDRAVQDMAEALKAMNIGVTIRKSMGNDISAACGQLASKN